MALSAFDDSSRQPTAAGLRKVLGVSEPLWRELIAHATDAFAPISEAWGFAGAKFGWSLRIKRADRVLLYMTPQDSCFLVGVVLGEKAVAEAHDAGLPEAVLQLIDGAPRYAEGRGIRVPVSASADLTLVRHLLDLKAATTAGAGRAAPVRSSAAGKSAPRTRGTRH